MFSDRINWIDLIFFHGFYPPGIRLRRSRWRTGMKPRKHNFASTKKRAKKPITGAFSLHYCIVGTMIEHLPLKRDYAFCLSSGKAKISFLSCDPV